MDHTQTQKSSKDKTLTTETAIEAANGLFPAPLLAGLTNFVFCSPLRRVIMIAVVSWWFDPAVICQCLSVLLLFSSYCITLDDSQRHRCVIIMHSSIHGSDEAAHIPLARSCLSCRAMLLFLKAPLTGYWPQFKTSAAITVKNTGDVQRKRNAILTAWLKATDWSKRLNTCHESNYF